MTSVANIEAGIKSATGGAVTLLKSIAIYAVMPVACVFLVVLLLFFIVTAAKKKKMGDDFLDDVWKCITVLIILGLVGSFTAWGWIMMGGTPETSAAVASVLMSRGIL